MIIVNQDKKSIYNFDNLVSITIVPDTDNEEYRVRCVDILGGTTLGRYATEKRAMDVLDKIVNAAGLGMYTYVMPKK